jgi:hypothetical protein
VADAESTRFLNAMEPAERTELMENMAQKIADGIIEDMQGIVEVFNGMREGLNEGRHARGAEELPHLELDGGRIRKVLEHGMEAALGEAVHAVLETALHAIFGAPARMPLEQAPASSLGPLPDLDRDPSDRALYLRWNRGF